MIDLLRHINTNLNEGYERGQGLEPLLQEFVEEVYNIDATSKERRKNAITGYYRAVLARTGLVGKAYRVTRKWAISKFIQPYISPTKPALPKPKEEKQLSFFESGEEVFAYHVAPYEARQSIRKFGLDSSRSLHSRSTSGENIYLFLDKGEANWYADYMSNQDPQSAMDIYAVKINRGFSNKDYSLTGTELDKESTAISYKGVIRNPELIKTVGKRFIKEDTSLEQVEKDLDDLLKIQKSDPSTKKEDYMKGLANGLAVAKALVTEQEPEFACDDEKEQFFLERTNKHIRLVRQAAETLLDTGKDFGFSLEDLVQNCHYHDSHKFHSPEKIPYIELTWRKKIGNKESTPEIITATLHHVSNSPHHPEYWLANKEEANINAKDRDKSDRCVDVSRMPPLAVAEMVCDWHAMGIEMGNTAREWFNKQKDVRWAFSEKQVNLINNLLDILEPQEVAENINEGFDLFPVAHVESFQCNCWMWRHIQRFINATCRDIFTTEELDSLGYNDGLDIDAERAKIVGERLLASLDKPQTDIFTPQDTEETKAVRETLREFANFAIASKGFTVS